MFVEPSDEEKKVILIAVDNVTLLDRDWGYPCYCSNVTGANELGYVSKKMYLADKHKHSYTLVAQVFVLTGASIIHPARNHVLSKDGIWETES